MVLRTYFVGFSMKRPFSRPHIIFCLWNAINGVFLTSSWLRIKEKIVWKNKSFSKHASNRVGHFNYWPDREIERMGQKHGWQCFSQNFTHQSKLSDYHGSGLCPLTFGRCLKILSWQISHYFFLDTIIINLATSDFYCHLLFVLNFTFCRRILAFGFYLPMAEPIRQLSSISGSDKNVQKKINRSCHCKCSWVFGSFGLRQTIQWKIGP